MGQDGARRKVMASHALNAASSRSHCLFTLHIETPMGPSCVAAPVHAHDGQGTRHAIQGTYTALGASHHTARAT